MKQTVRSPFTTSEADKLSSRLFRKQVLKFGEIDYHGRVVRFDPSYAADVITAFRDSAFDTVPFVLADENNKHTRDPERARGEIVDLEATDTGLDAIISLNQDAAKLVDQHPKLGVSVSIKEQFSRADGKHYPRALAHVLGTFEPMLPGMSPWQTVDAARVTDHVNASQGEDEELVLDLSTIELGTKPKENKMPKRTEEEQEALFSRLEALLDALEAEDVADGDEDEEQEVENEESEEDGDLTDEDIEFMRQFLADQESDAERETVNASAELDEHTIELSRTLEAQQAEIRRLTAENDRRAFQTERDEIVRALGIPPAVVDLARPLLQGRDHQIELSDTGKKVDAGQVMRDVFKAIGQQIKMLDLSGEMGHNLDLSEREEQSIEDRVARVKALRKQMNI